MKLNTKIGFSELTLSKPISITVLAFVWLVQLFVQVNTSGLVDVYVLIHSSLINPETERPTRSHLLILYEGFQIANELMNAFQNVLGCSKMTLISLKVT